MIALLVWAMVPITQMAWMANVPRKPDIVHGFVHPESIRGTVYYFNATQRNIQVSLEWGALLFGAVGVALWKKSADDARKWRG